jgi:hypothetical protein
MKNLLVRALVVLSFSVFNPSLSTARAQGAAFTYQGQLQHNGSPATGAYDFTFTLYDTPTGGGAIGAPVTNNSVGVTNGLFTVLLDFGSGAFTGASNWLQIAVATNGSSAFTNLAPRQLLTPAPYAIFAATAGNYNGTVSASQLTGAIPSSQLVGAYSGVVTLSNPADSFSGNGAGLAMLNAANLATGTVPDGRLSANVALRAGGNTFNGNQIFATGNLGVGNAAPKYKLDLLYGGGVDGLHVGSSGGFSAVDIDAPAADAVVQFQNGGAGKWGIGNDGPSNGFKLVDLVSGFTRLWVQSGSGSVGIGTSTPGAALDTRINSAPGAGSLISQFGSQANPRIEFYDENISATLGPKIMFNAGNVGQIAGGGNIAFMPTGGVGVGTTTPAAEFHAVALQYGSQPLGIFEVENCGVPCAQQDYQENIRLLNSNPNGQTGLGFLTAQGSSIYTVPSAWIGTDYGDGGGANNLKFATQRNGSLVDRMYISYLGNVGIGAAPSHGKLDIEGDSNGYTQGAGTVEMNYDIALITYDPNGASGPWPCSLYTSGDIACAGSVYCVSDERTKHVIGHSDGARDLATLLGLEVADYTYIDTIAKGRRPQKKVVAQQVEKVFPLAVSRSTNEVPDIYKPATVKDGWVRLATDLKVGERVKLIGDNERGTYPVLEVRDGAFRTDFKPATDKVFVYGREVGDFRTVDYDAIAMLNVSATQELARKLDAREAALTKLQEKLDQTLAERETLLKRLADLEARDEAREDRLARLESSLGKASARVTYSSLKQP